MKLSTRARYGLRMMVELAKELKNQRLVHLGRISQITGLSENYLAQLAIPLRNEGLLIGVSGKGGGYYLARPPEQIRVGEIVKAVIGQINLTDCVSNPDICMNSPFCEARLIWVILSGEMNGLLNSFTLADLIDKAQLEEIKKEHKHLPLLNADKYMSNGTYEDGVPAGCPVSEEEDKEELDR